VTPCLGHAPQLRRWLDEKGELKDVTGVDGKALGIKQRVMAPQLGASCNACHCDWERHSPALPDVIAAFLANEDKNEIESFEFDPFYGPPPPSGAIDHAYLASFTFEKYLSGAYD
jgi:hypothetical protein